ncbi:unnamed protein product [Cuscuta epithymum]|uniref:Uncharacterized protein n=1 Tax=Cuscuta epithymum TaxID=186058 RepID=A0AAV0FF67_9ASTE|nr:unnamed protein product [Cuscuta epithymum]
MKLSLKVHDPRRSPPQPQQLSNHQNHLETRPLLLRAKIPIAIFNLPFISGFTTTTQHPSDLSVSLATNFSSGPNLKLAYTASSSSSSSAAPPLTLSLKSGIGVFGSPKNSPLIICASFSLCPLNPQPAPTFTLLLKPQFGSFSLKKATSSNPNPSPKHNGLSNSFGFVPLDRPTNFKDFSSVHNGKESLVKGVSIMARTEMQITKKALISFRWGVNLPEDLGNRMPYLNLNKVRVERVDDEVKELKKEKSWSDVELLKGMCLWMKKELDSLQRENREMTAKLETMKTGHFLKTGSSKEECVGKKTVAPIVESSSGLEQWRNKKNYGGDNGKKEVKTKVTNENRSSELESELQKALSAATASSS